MQKMSKRQMAEMVVGSAEQVMDNMTLFRALAKNVETAINALANTYPTETVQLLKELHDNIEQIETHEQTKTIFRDSMIQEMTENMESTIHLSETDEESSPADPSVN